MSILCDFSGKIELRLLSQNMFFLKMPPKMCIAYTIDIHQVMLPHTKVERNIHCVSSCSPEDGQKIFFSIVFRAAAMVKRCWPEFTETQVRFPTYQYLSRPHLNLPVLEQT